MNKKPMSRFFNLNLHHDGGFTLVELIVVIAILAILAGVAVPVYSGYIAKANTAADEQLLSAVNTAFASACALNGESHIGRKDTPRLDLDENTVKGVITGTEAVNTDFGTLFETSKATFTQIDVSKLIYDSLQGVFRLSGITTLDNWSVDEATAQAFKLSIFGNGTVMSVNDLLSNADDIVQWVHGEGIQPIDMNDPEFVAFYDSLKRQAGLDGKNFDESQAKLNALVLYTAQASAGLKDDENLTGYITDGVSTGYNGTTDPAEQVAGIAMKYAVGMAFVREYNKEHGYDENSPGYIEPTSYDAVMDALKAEKTELHPITQTPTTVTNPVYTEFQTWFATDGQSAMDGYLAAMDMLDENTETLSEDEAKKLLINGFGSDEYFSGKVDDLMNQVP